MGKLVVVVDNEQTIRSLLRDQLENEGYEVIDYSDGGEVKANKSKVLSADAVITDRSMSQDPGKNGDAVVRWLDAILSPRGLSKPFVIMLTGDKIERLPKDVWKKCFVITKPFELDQLLYLLQRVA